MQDKKSTAGNKEQKWFYVSVVQAERTKCHQKFLPHSFEGKVDWLHLVPHTNLNRHINMFKILYNLQFYVFQKVTQN